MAIHRAVQPEVGNARKLAGGVLLALATLIAVIAAVVFTAGNYQITRVLSNSMQPSFSAGDYVIVQDRPVSELGAGQVVVLPEPETSAMYIHRVTSVVRDGGDTVVATKGDNNPAADDWQLKITSATVPVLVGVISTHGLAVPALSPAVAQMILALGLALVAVLILLPNDERRQRPRRRALHAA